MDDIDAVESPLSYPNMTGTLNCPGEAIHPTIRQPLSEVTQNVWGYGTVLTETLQPFPLGTNGSYEVTFSCGLAVMDPITLCNLNIVNCLVIAHAPWAAWVQTGTMGLSPLQMCRTRVVNGSLPNGRISIAGNAAPHLGAASGECASAYDVFSVQ